MACRVTIYFISPSIMPILVVASAGLESGHAQAKLDAYYTATILGLPIGHISWVIDLKENRFSSVATGSIAGFLRLFLDAQGSVAAEGRLSGGKPAPSKFQLKLLAGKWSDEVGIVFTGNRAKESVFPTSASRCANERRCELTGPGQIRWRDKRLWSCGRIQVKGIRRPLSRRPTE